MKEKLITFSPSYTYRYPPRDIFSTICLHHYPHHYLLPSPHLPRQTHTTPTYKPTQPPQHFPQILHQNPTSLAKPPCSSPINHGPQHSTKHSGTNTLHKTPLSPSFRLHHTLSPPKPPPPLQHSLSVSLSQIPPHLNSLPPHTHTHAGEEGARRS